MFELTSDLLPRLSLKKPHLTVEMKHSLGALEIDAAFELTQPWTILFAPSGAGKTSILRAIAGLLEPQRARIVSLVRIPLQDGRELTTEVVLTDTDSGVLTPTQRRYVRLVSQRTALFPHLSVLDNIRYASFGANGKQSDDRYNEEQLRLLALCRVDHLVSKMPSQLSGGERQRVDLARSLAAPRCNLLLLDEPFTGLDAALRDELIADLRPWLEGRNIPVLSVTHDISEAFQLDAEVLKLNNGRIVDQGPVHVVLAHERTRLLSQMKS